MNGRANVAPLLFLLPAVCVTNSSALVPPLVPQRPKETGEQDTPKRDET